MAILLLEDKQLIPMAEALKHMYNPQFFKRLCPVLQEVIPGFNSADFTRRIFDKSWPDLELKQRVRHIALVLHHFLPHDFPAAARLLTQLALALRKSGVSEQGFTPIFIPDYIEVFGLDYPDESLAAIEEVTKLVSAEFAIRHFIMRYPEKTMARMMAWAKHREASVRRLATEGCRPRLPWAIGLPAFKKDPARVLAILEKLKNDPSEYVRRSVANNLDDIAKDHPELVLQIARRWMGKRPETDRIIRHGCRTLLKKGNLAALSLHGFDPKAKAKVKDLAIAEKKIRIGEYLHFSFLFLNQEKLASDFRLEYAIDFITSSGRTSRKVFRITEQTFRPRMLVSVAKKQAFKDLTTRKHFKGKHHLHILVNGKALASATFMILK